MLAKQMAAAQAGEDPMQYSWPQKSGSVLAVGGAVMEVDWGKPEGERVRSILVDGEPLDASRVYKVATSSYLPVATDVYPALAEAELMHEYGTCEQALRALIAQDGWEQTMTNLSGSVTYVSDGASGDAGGDTAGGSADASAGSASGPLALPATGDAAEPAAAVLLACALASALVAAAATRRARRERWRDAG